jgi:hypothetical protein
MQVDRWSNLRHYVDHIKFHENISVDSRAATDKWSDGSGITRQSLLEERKLAAPCFTSQRLCFGNGMGHEQEFYRGKEICFHSKRSIATSVGICLFTL